MQGLQSQERAVTCHQNVHWLKQDQGHVVEVVVIANPSPYTLLTVSLLLALSTMHLNTNPYKTVFFSSMDIFNVWKILPHPTPDDLMILILGRVQGKISSPSSLNLPQCHGALHLCLSSYQNGKPSRWTTSPFNTMALGVTLRKHDHPALGTVAEPLRSGDDVLAHNVGNVESHGNLPRLYLSKSSIPSAFLVHSKPPVPSLSPTSLISRLQGS